MIIQGLVILGGKNIILGYPVNGRSGGKKREKREL